MKERLYLVTGAMGHLEMCIRESDIDKPELPEVARDFAACGFHLIATENTCKAIRAAGIPCDKIDKIGEGRPNILDAIANHEIQIIVNTPICKKSAEDDSYIRKAAIKNRITHVNTMAAANASAEGIRAVKEGGTPGVKSLQAYNTEIKDTV